MQAHLYPDIFAKTDAAGPIPSACRRKMFGL